MENSMEAAQQTKNRSAIVIFGLGRVAEFSHPLNPGA
jgi:hypothetical protein